MPDNKPEMVEATDTEGKPVMVAKTTPEETVPSVRTQRGTIFSRAEQDRRANVLLKDQQNVGESVGADSTQDASTTSFPPLTSGAPARGGAAKKSTSSPNKE